LLPQGTFSLTVWSAVSHAVIPAAAVPHIIPVVLHLLAPVLLPLSHVAPTILPAILHIVPVIAPMVTAVIPVITHIVELLIPVIMASLTGKRGNCKK